MNVKLLLYFIALPLSIWGLESINFEKFLKKNRTVQVQVLYFLCSLALSYLVVNFCYDVFLNSAFI